MTNQVATKPENIDIFDPKNITAGTGITPACAGNTRK